MLRLQHGLFVRHDMLYAFSSLTKSNSAGITVRSPAILYGVAPAMAHMCAATARNPAVYSCAVCDGAVSDVVSYSCNRKA